MSRILHVYDYHNDNNNSDNDSIIQPHKKRIIDQHKTMLDVSLLKIWTNVFHFIDNYNDIINCFKTCKSFKNVYCYNWNGSFKTKPYITDNQLLSLVKALPSLFRFDIYCHQRIRDDNIKTISMNLKQLHTIRLYSCLPSIGPLGISYLNELKHLKCIIFEDNYVISIVVLRPLIVNKTVTTLHFINCKTFETNLIEMLFIVNKYNMKEILFDFCEFSTYSNGFLLHWIKANKRIHNIVKMTDSCTVATNANKLSIFI